MQILSVLYVGITVSSALLTGWLGLYAWSRRDNPSAKIFALLMACFTYTCLVFVVMSISSDRQIVYFSARARFLGLALIPTLLLLSVLRYTDRERWLRPGPVLLLFIIPLITQIMVWTDTQDGRFISNWTFVQYGLISVEVAQFSGWFWIHTVYSYVLTITTAIILITNLVRAPGIYRRQALFVLIGIAAAVVLNVPSRLSNVPNPVPNLTPISLAIGGIVLAVMIFRFNLLTIAPIANDRVLESMGDGVIVVDAHNRVVSFNPAAADLIQPFSGNVIGTSLNELFPEYPQLTSRFGHGSGSTQEVQIGPARHDYEWKVSPIYGRGQHVIGRVIILRDIAQRKLAQQRASELAIEREKVKMLANFVHDTSHELRTPLSVMRVSLYLLKKGIDREAQSEQMQTLEAQLAQLELIVEQLNRMVNLDTGLMADLKPMSVNLIRQSIPSGFANLIDNKHITLDWQLQSDLAPVEADEALFTSAFQNLLHNAILYTPPGGRVIVRTGCDESHSIFVEVSDNGVGIDAEALPHIFERFYKANKARTANGSGMGLGLAMVKKIMELHGGTVSVQSAVDQGSTFRVTFPASQNSLIVPGAELPAPGA